MNMCIKLLWAEVSYGGFCLLTVQVAMHACRPQCWFIVRAFAAAADRFNDTDAKQAVPMRLCMSTAAGHKEQLPMDLQYEELAQGSPSVSCLP